MAVDHYENFPVASVLLPRRLRGAVRDIYRFARSADDIADEGTALPEERLASLAAYRSALGQIERAELHMDASAPLYAVFAPLAGTIARHGLPLEPFYDLLSAFEQDVSKTRYASDAELLDYCSRSANPVGRLMLQLYNRADASSLEEADAICTGLQLTNFWQDVAIDWGKDRVYLPQDKLQQHGVQETYLAHRIALARQDDAAAATTPPSRSRATDSSQLAWQSLMQGQVQQAREMLLRGLPLTSRLPGRIGLELKLVVHGGLRILQRLDQLHYDIFLQRPTLKKSDWILLVWRALG